VILYKVQAIMNSNQNNQINLTIIQIKKSPRMLIKIKRMLVN